MNWPRLSAPLTTIIASLALGGNCTGYQAQGNLVYRFRALSQAHLRKGLATPVAQDTPETLHAVRGL